MLSSFIWSRFVKGIKLSLGMFNLEKADGKLVKNEVSCNLKVAHISLVPIVLFQETRKPQLRKLVQIHPLSPELFRVATLHVTSQDRNRKPDAGYAPNADSTNCTRVHPEAAPGLRGIEVLRSNTSLAV